MSYHKNNKPTKTKKTQNYQYLWSKCIYLCSKLTFSLYMIVYICCFCCEYFFPHNSIIIASWAVYSFIVLLWHLRKTRGKKTGMTSLVRVNMLKSVVNFSKDEGELVFQRERGREREETK